METNSIVYPWRRLWLPAEAASESSYLSSAGYLKPPTGGQVLADWADRRCLILLGEPGMGKSAEWQAARVVPPAASFHVFINLRDFEEENILRDEINAEPQVEAWRAAPEGDLYLWLDSFDEGLLHISKLAAAVLRLIRRWPADRLRLRIASRIATWPDSLTVDLRDYFDPKPSAGPSQLEVLH